MTRDERIEAVARAIFQHRMPISAARHPEEYALVDKQEAERFIDMLDAATSSPARKMF